MKKLLIVDDEERIRTVVKTYAENDGFEVFEAGDGYEALEIIEKEDSFIFDGNYKSTMDLRFAASDTIIFLDFPTSTNLRQSVKKSLTEDNADNEDPDLDHTGKINLKYINRLINFEKEDRQEIIDKLNELKLEKRIIIIDSRSKKDLFLQSIA